MTRPRLEAPRKAVTVKLPPALLDQVAARAAKLGCTKTAFYERALEAALGGAVAPAQGEDGVAPVKGLVERRMDPGEARAAAFRAARARRG